MRLILIRHAETQGNKEKLMTGQYDEGLDALGKEQAGKLGKRLKGLMVDKFYVSDLKRARETAAEIIQFHQDVPVVYDPRLREQNFGVLENNTWPEFRLDQIKQGVSWIEHKPKNGESVGELFLRVWDFYLRMEEEGIVVWVTHGGVIAALLVQLFNEPIEQFIKHKISNTSVTVIKVDGAAKLVEYNSVSHLD
ncbi:MAG: histidine phosphatase family protein [Candidatus Woesearchaeota archaeon]